MTPGARAVLLGAERWELHTGDCLPWLRGLPPASVDACITDPPSSAHFLGRRWDGDRGGRAPWVAWLAEVGAELRRVLKPGAGLAVWALPRRAHWAATALEDAGLELRDKLYHLQAQGRPQGKALPGDRHSTLKPAVEEWLLARAPLAEELGANLARFGVGALHLADTRAAGGQLRWERPRGVGYGGGGSDAGPQAALVAELGRHPANFAATHAAACAPGSCACALAELGAELGQRVVNFFPVFYAPRARGAGRSTSHPTEKPLSLIEHLCALLCPPGGVVIDPFAGSATTGAAALRRGLRFLGAELAEADDGTAAEARARLERLAPKHAAAG